MAVRNTAPVRGMGTWLARGALGLTLLAVGCAGMPSAHASHPGVLAERTATAKHAAKHSATRSDPGQLAQRTRTGHTGKMVAQPERSDPGKIAQLTATMQRASH